MSESPVDDFADALTNPDSDVCHKALEELSVVLSQLGLKVRKKSPKEATLRVYLPGKPYPLLNPRFRFVSFDDVEPLPVLSLVVTVLSKGDDELDRRLADFPSDSSAKFMPVAASSGRYYCHGHFVIRLSDVVHDGRIDLARVGPSLRRMAERCGLQ